MRPVVESVADDALVEGAVGVVELAAAAASPLSNVASACSVGRLQGASVPILKNFAILFRAGNKHLFYGPSIDV